MLLVLDPLIFYSSAGERLRIDTSGNVGIGETSPSTYGKLVVTGSTPFAVLRSSDVTTAGFSMLVNSGSNGVGSIATDNGGHMTFDTGSTGASQAERMRIDASGNVSIGTSNSLGVLTIKAPASDDEDIITITEDGINQAFSINGNFAGSGSTGNAITLDSYWADDIISFRGDGNVGIGSGNPQNKLDIEQSAAVSARLLATGATSSSLKLEVKGGATQLTTTEILANSSGAMTFATGTTSSAERMRLDASGNVGIGVVPNAGWNSTYKAIQVGNAGAVWSEDASSSNTLISNNEVYNTNGSYYRLVAGAANDILLQNNGSFQFRSTATSAAANSIISDQTTKMTLDASGYLAIGTSSTGFNGQGLPLVVGSGTGSTGMTIFSGADSYGTLQFADAVTTGAASYAGVVSYNHTSNFMYFSTASTERMRIDSSGNVGIGTGSPTAITNYTTVTVNGTTGGVLDFENGEVLNSRLVGEAGGLVVSGEGSRYIKFHTNNAERMRISSSGNLLVGTTDSDMSNNSGDSRWF